MNQRTKDDIKKILLVSAEESAIRAQNFVKKQLILAKDHPLGVRQHYKELIFDQKKSIQDNTLGSIWISNECPNIYQDHVLDHFINVLEWMYNFFNDMYERDLPELENRSRKQNLLKSIKTYGIGSFFDAVIIIDLVNKELNSVTPIPLKFEIIKQGLLTYDFYELPKVKSLQASDELVELITSNDTPYKIALLNFLGFLDHIKKKYADNYQGRTEKILSEILYISTDSVKKNILSLNNNSKISKSRYTSYKHVETVKNDYMNLK